MTQVTLNNGSVDSSGSLLLKTNGTTTAVTVDTAQNVGVGVTPSAWTSIKALQVVNASFGGLGGGNYSAANAYYDGTNWKYITSNYATLYQQSGNSGDGVHKWNVAASGTAGNAISFTQAMTLDASGNLGVGTTSPLNKFHVAGSARISGVSSGSAALFIPAGDLTSDVSSGSFAVGNYGDSSSELRLSTRGFTTFRTGATDGTNGTERARIDSSGTLLVGRTTAVSATTRLGLDATASIAGFVSETGPTTSVTHGKFFNGNGLVGSISTNGSATTYSTSSDYRLKENVEPMTGALARVSALKPVTYTWKIDGAAGEGFIAHELQAVVPDAVIGEKDAVETQQYEITPAIPATYDEEGNELTPAVEAVMGEREVPVYQGIDTSFLVATLTAAIQEQQALIQTLTDRIEALEAK